VIAGIEREAPALLKEDYKTFYDIPDELWDGAGLLMAVVLVFALVTISVGVIVSLKHTMPKKQAATMAMTLHVVGEAGDTK